MTIRRLHHGIKITKNKLVVLGLLGRRLELCVFVFVFFVIFLYFSSFLLMLVEYSEENGK